MEAEEGDTPASGETPVLGDTPVPTEIPTCITPTSGETLPLGETPISENTMTSTLISDLQKQPSASDEEEDEERTGVVSSHGDEVPHIHGAGVGVGRSMNYGPLWFHPSLNIARLLNPLSSSEQPHPLISCPPHDQSCDLPCSSHDEPCDLPHPSYATPTCPPTNRNLESFLAICRRHFNFTPTDSAYAQRLYGMIEGAGEGGVEEEELREVCGSAVSEGGGGWSLQDHVTSLINLEMVSM